MKIPLTPYLLNRLIHSGYRYVLSKTTGVTGAMVNIHLTPVKDEPDVRHLPAKFDTYFNITDEPTQMACGIDKDTRQTVNMPVRMMRTILGQAG